MIDWRFARFDELSPREVHDLYRARIAAFVVEQDCVFQDLDGVDPECWHLLGYEGTELVAYCRLVPPGVKYPEPSIGRVVTTQAARGTGRGRALMAEALARAEKLWPGRPIRIGAQQRLERFYEDFGFVTASAPYDEDGILHVEMVRPAGRVKEGRGQTVG
ncbi:MAG TPA: GNAT family N-acetyltransferase [Usitatibacter sp.]|nr:GNAT family N-acetyltransferase [Usitatibacter sp.]